MLGAAIGARRHLSALPWPRIAITLVAAALIWAALSVLWAIEPGRVPRSWLPIALTAAGGLLLLASVDSLDEGARMRIGDGLAAGIIVALAILTVEAVPRYLGVRPTPQQWIAKALSLRFDASALNRASSVIAISIWIAAVAVARRHGWRFAWLLPAWAAALAPAFESLAAVAATGAAAAITAITIGARHATRGLMIGAVALAFALMPLVALWARFREHFTDREQSGSIWHRAEIWSFVAERIFERPMLGWGLNAARVMPGGKDFIEPGVEKLPLHPHNGVLQLWLELGIVGAAFGAAIAVAAVLHATAPTRGRYARVAMAAAIAAGLTVIGVGYGLWQGWWMAALWLIAALARAVPDTDAA